MAQTTCPLSFGLVFIVAAQLSPPRPSSIRKVQDLLKIYLMFAYHTYCPLS